MTKTPIAVLGIDLGKNSCSLAGMDAAGTVVMRKRMTHDAIVTFATTLPACVIAMEACCGARQCQEFRVRAGIEGKKETRDVPMQRACNTK